LSSSALPFLDLPFCYFYPLFLQHYVFGMSHLISTLPTHDADLPNCRELSLC
jgi:hypothetical protein